MKLFKYSTLLFACLAALPVFAQNYISRAETGVKTDAIHTLEVTNSGNRVIVGQFTLYPGTWKHGVCIAAKAISAGAFQFNAYTRASMVISGYGLTNGIGLGFNCLDLVLSTDKQITHDVFSLFNNNIVYTHTDPNYDSVTIN